MLFCVPSWRIRLLAEALREIWLRDSEISKEGSSYRWSSEARLKKCPNCNSISRDSDLSCGVCGGDISAAVSGTLESLIAKRPPTRPRTVLHAKGLAALASGLGTVALGVYLLFASGAIGLFFLLIGVIVLVSIVDIDGGWFGGIWDGGWPSKDSERQANDRWDKERKNQERGVDE